MKNLIILNHLIIIFVFTPLIGKTSFASEPVPKGQTIAGRVVSLSGSVLARNEGISNKPRTLSPGWFIYSGDTINNSSNATVKILMGDRSIIDIGPSSLFQVNKYVPGKAVDDRQVDLSLAYGRIRVSVNKPLSDKGRFKVQTKAATMGVRGTEFIVKAELPYKDVSPKTSALSGAGSSALAATAGASINSSSSPGQGKDSAGSPTLAGGATPEVKKPESGTQITVVEGKVAVGTSSSGSSEAKQMNLTAGQQMTASSDKSGSASVPAVTQISMTQAQAIKTEVRLQDNTFQSNVVVSNNSSSGSSGSNATVTAIAAIVAPPPKTETKSAQTANKESAKEGPKEGTKESKSSSDVAKGSEKGDSSAREPASDESSGTNSNSADTSTSASSSESDNSFSDLSATSQVEVFESISIADLGVSGIDNIIAPTSLAADPTAATNVSSTIKLKVNFNP